MRIPMSKRFIKSALFSALLASASLSHGMSVDGAGTIVVIPIFAQTPIYTSELTIFNPNSQAASIAPTFVGMDGRSSPSGRTVCTTLSVPANTSVQYSLSALCPSLTGGSNNGNLTLKEISGANRPFFAYSRIQNTQGIGFSVEGFPIGTFEGGVAVSTGLKRQAAAPAFQSNCHVASMSEPVDFTITLLTSSGSVIGSKSGSLSAYQMIAYVDIFAAAGAPAGDYSNVRAVFINSNPASGAALLGMCTVQDNTSYGADFRIAKTINPEDESKQRVNTVGSTRLGQPFSITDASKRNTHVLYLRHPDQVSCYFGTDPTASNPNLQMRFIGPQNESVVSGAAVDGFLNVPIGGGASLIKSGTNNGVNGRWLLEVATEAGVPAPQSYSITCKSGNGHSMLDIIDMTQPRF